MSPPPAPHAPARLDVLGCLALSIILAGCGTRPPAYSSVAVLPFENLSDDPDATYYLADGMGEILTSRLTQLEGLLVIPWVTSMRFADSGRQPAEIARELGVDALLTGTFRVVGDRVQGALRLVDAETGLEPWSRGFEEPLPDLMKVIRELAVEAGGALRGRLSAEEAEQLGRSPAVSFAAFEYYLRGSDAYRAAADERTLRAARDLFQRALELDPDLALAHVGLGAANYRLYYWGMTGIDDLDGAEASFLRALELDPRLTRAHGGMVRVFHQRGDAEACLRTGRDAARGGELDTDALLVRAEAYVLCGLPERGIDVAERALEADPASIAARYMGLLALFSARRHAEAVREAEALEDEFGADYEITGRLVQAYLALGREEDLRSTLERMAPCNMWCAAALDRLGERERGGRLMDEAIAAERAKVEAHPTNANHQGLLAFELALRGDREGFERQRAWILEHAGENGRLLDWMGMGHLLLGEVGPGLEMLRAAQEAGWIPYREFDPLLPEAVVADPDYLAFWEESRRATSRLRAEY